MPRTYMIGNWKMNQSLADLEAFFSQIDITLNQNNYWIAPQLIHLDKCLKLGAAAGLLIGAQNTSQEDNGAFTGETSAASLMEMGAHFTLVGHSERRSLYNETDDMINAKIKKSVEKGLVPVLCVGESLSERESGKTKDIVLSQIKAGLKNIELNNEAELIVAYEPVWAIGTGKTATPEMAQEVHAAIRELLVKLYGEELGQDISILYGGSVKPANVEELLAQKDINGGLVGGASLKASDFSKLCNAAI